ncbi:MAG: two-component system sensor histidine kinase NtrB [Planctomycetota bacterium]|jgi:PAS domain S-box-containing protein
MQVGLVVLDGEGRVALFNAAAERILGHRVRDVLGMPGKDVLEGLTGIVSDARRGSRAEGAATERKASVRHRDGRLVPLTVTAHPMPAEADRPGERDPAGPDEGSASADEGSAARGGAILVFQDARQLEKMEKQLQHLDRLRSLDEFAAGIVHEIRNPLAGITINAQHLAEEIERRCRGSCAKTGRPGRFGEEMQDILADVQSIESIVKKVLDFAHPNKPEVRECAVEDVVKEALRFSKMPLRRRGIRLVTDLRASARVRVDVSQIKQVLFNIVRNARDAMPGGGELRVRTRKGTIRPKGPDGRATRPSGNGHVRVEVEDTGRGIAREYLERIFDPFFSMHREGSGLGLAISRKIVGNHGGTIEVASELGKGTRFAIALPTV